MKPTDRQGFARILQRYPGWGGTEGDRKAILLQAGFPSSLVSSLEHNLGQKRKTAASLVVSELERIGFLPEPGDVTPLGLLAEFLMEHFPDVNVIEDLKYLLDQYGWRKVAN